MFCVLFVHLTFSDICLADDDDDNDADGERMPCCAVCFVALQRDNKEERRARKANAMRLMFLNPRARFVTTCAGASLGKQRFDEVIDCLSDACGGMM